MSRYSRQVAVPSIGLSGQQRIQKTTAAVIGAGGLGHPIVGYLASAGLGELLLVDDDTVSEDNLARQFLFLQSDIGSNKADVLARYISRQNKDVRVRTFVGRLSRSNSATVLNNVDILIDASDNFETRYLASDAALALGIPHVWGAVYRFEASVGVFPPDPARNYRAHYPEPPPSFLSPTCESGGVVGAICGLAGSVMACEVLQLAANGTSALLGKTVDLDASHFTTSPRDVVDGGTQILTTGKSCQPHLISTANVQQILSDKSPGVVIVDVRNDSERARGAIPGSIHVPLDVLWNWARTWNDDDASMIIFYCESGKRSEHAVEIWRRVGRSSAAVSLDGGIRSFDESYPDGMGV